MRIIDLLERTLQTDASFVYDIMERGRANIDKAINMNSLLSNLNRLFSTYNIRFEHNEAGLGQYEMNPTIEKGIVSATTFKNGDIVIYVNSLLFDTVQSDKGIEAITELLASLVRHELVHRQQFVRSAGKMDDQYPQTRYSKLGDYQKYVADPHELYAMAHEIIEQLQQRGISDQQILNALKVAKSSLLFRSERYVSIYDHFFQNDPHKIIPRLKKTIYQTLTIPTNGG